MDSLQNHGDADGKKIAGVLGDALRYDGSEEDKIISRLTEEQEKKWGNIRSILNQDKKENIAIRSEVAEVLQGKRTLDSLSALGAFKIGNIKATQNNVSAVKTLESQLNDSNRRTLQQFENI